MAETAPNRNRSRQVKFWVSEEEYALLQKKMKAAGGVNQGAYIRKMILDGYIVNHRRRYGEGILPSHY